ncbi:MAG: ABC transporter ATP-binding protein [Crenarchaeota archaeon]|nr:ABC transporter ATP-binding protein [Thermoproteota archaeon]
MFRLEDVHVAVADSGREIVHGVTVEVAEPGIYVVMGPNGAGKSSLANAVMGHQGYRLKGRVLLAGEDVTSLPTHEKARRGMTLAVQNPPEIEGVRVAEVLAKIIQRFQGISDIAAANREAARLLELVGLPREMMSRYLMVGMSGGERKRLELARVLAQRPKVAFLDEPDSGVDIESLPLIAKAIKTLAEIGAIVFLITHQPHLAKMLLVRQVIIMYGGRIIATGGPSLIDEVQEKGYTRLAAEAQGEN